MRRHHLGDSCRKAPTKRELASYFVLVLAGQLDQPLPAALPCEPLPRKSASPCRTIA